jgi:polysaccharide lyase-like protein
MNSTFARVITILATILAAALSQGAEQVLKNNQPIELWGHKWVAQTANTGGARERPGIAVAGDGARFQVRTGEFAPGIDPPDGRKLRAELCCLTKFGKGERFKAAFTFLIPPGKPNPELQWRSIFQIHQADTRDSKGVPLKGAPLFALEVVADPKSPTGEMLVVRAETSTGDGSTWPTPREFARAPFTRGVEHQAAIEIIDSHGLAGGLVRVQIDGVAMVDQPNIPVGYSYVDLPILWGGRSQDTRSYAKLGIYAGNQRRPPDMELETVIRHVSMSVQP